MTPPGGALAHRCQACNDWDRHHEHQVQDVRGRHWLRITGGCRVWGCPCPGYQRGPSEVYPLYLGQGPTGGTRLDYVVQPGSILHGQVSCTCSSCRAYYAALSRVVSAAPRTEYL